MHEQTKKYAIIMKPGPPLANALPVPRKTPLPILDPREMICEGEGSALYLQKTVG